VAAGYGAFLFSVSSPAISAVPFSSINSILIGDIWVNLLHIITYDIFVNFCVNTDCLLNYLEDIRNTMVPHTRIDIPMPIIIEPLTVQPGLLYINEEDGPTMDLLCSVNIIPRIINTRPTTINDLLARLFRFVNNYRSYTGSRNSIKGMTLLGYIWCSAPLYDGLIRIGLLISFCSVVKACLIFP
jgi:hypothetical protein